MSAIKFVGYLVKFVERNFIDYFIYIVAHFHFAAPNTENVRTVKGVMYNVIVILVHRKTKTTYWNDVFMC